MLIEIWERLRGYDKWIEASAKIESSDVNRTAHYGRNGDVSYTYDSADELVWMDRQGQKQSAGFSVDDESPIYQLVDGSSVTIRYNPARPDSYYFRALLQSRIRRFFQLVKQASIFLAVLGALIALNYYTHRK